MRSLAGRDVWVFDLDNTLYDAETALFPQIESRMTDYVAQLTGLDRKAAHALQHRYLMEYGATITGLLRRHEVDAQHFLDFVHDVDTSAVPPDPELAGLIAALPGRKLVYTNGSRSHADRVLGRLGLTGLFEARFAIEDADLHPKPQLESFARLIEAHRIEPTRAAMFEDAARNLMTAHALGFATILVRPDRHARERLPHVDHETACLKSFLRGLLAALD